MVDKATYINSKGQRLELGVAPYYLNYNDLRDYQWKYEDSAGGKIERFIRDVTSKTLPIIVISDDEDDRNNLYDIIEHDVVNKSQGKLFIGDYFIEGYFIESDKKDYLEKNRMEISLKFISETGAWKRIIGKKFRHAEEQESEEPFLTYPYTYPYDYRIGRGVLIVENISKTESDFVMRIYGYCQNPEIIIGGNRYMVKTTVYANEFLIIDSRNKTVIRYKADGKKIDEFNNRDRSVNIFAKILSGNGALQHNIPNGLDIDLIDERSEPLWTSS